MSTAAAILNPTTDPPASSAVSNQPSAPANTNPNPAWYDSVQDPDTKAWLANKKYESPEMLAKAGRSLEQLFGADKAGRAVILPKDEKDEEGLKAFRSKIGVPESIDGYKLPIPEGDDGSFAKVAAGWFHKNNVPASAAEAMAKEWNDYLGSQIKAADEAEKQKTAQELDALKIEWAHEFDTRSETAKRGFREVGQKAGLSEEDLKRLESSLGTAKMLKTFEQIGRYVSEAAFAGGNGKGGGFGNNPQQAQDRVNAIIQDRASGKINDHQWRTESQPEIDRLLQIITTTKTA